MRGAYLTLAAVMLVIVAAASCSRVTVERPGAATPWTCAEMPPHPKQQDGGFRPNGRSDYVISIRDTNAVTDYVAALEGAYSSCRATVDAVNRINKVEGKP